MSAAVSLEQPKDAGDGAVAHQDANSESHEYGYDKQKRCEECDLFRHPVMRSTRIPVRPYYRLGNQSLGVAMVRSLSI